MTSRMCMMPRQTHACVPCAGDAPDHLAMQLVMKASRMLLGDYQRLERGQLIRQGCWTACSLGSAVAVAQRCPVGVKRTGRGRG